MVNSADYEIDGVRYVNVFDVFFKELASIKQDKLRLEARILNCAGGTDALSLVLTTASFNVSANYMASVVNKDDKRLYNEVIGIVYSVKKVLSKDYLSWFNSLYVKLFID